jgi:hypothetical protein
MQVTLCGGRNCCSVGVSLAQACLQRELRRVAVVGVVQQACKLHLAGVYTGLSAVL